jgi:adenylate kinase
LLDGFPRNINQANVLDNILSANGNQIDKVVLFTLPDDVLLRRLTGRRTCSKTGEILNIYFSSKEKLQACLDLGGTLIQRKDDQEEIISNRISVYKSETFPLINYYEEKNLLVKVNAESPVAMVHQELLSSLNLNCMS